VKSLFTWECGQAHQLGGDRLRLQRAGAALQVISLHCCAPLLGRHTLPASFAAMLPTFLPTLPARGHSVCVFPLCFHSFVIVTCPKQVRILYNGDWGEA
jgi:hypothetical protein